MIDPIVLKIALLVVMALGTFGQIIPIIPGLTITWLAALVYGVVTGFTPSAWVYFGLITALMLFGSVLDNIMMAGGAKQSGASWLAVGATTVGGIVGSLFWPPFGGLLLAMAGLLAVEIIRLRDMRRAMVSARSVAIGCGLSILARIGVGVVMMVLFAFWAFGA